MVSLYLNNKAPFLQNNQKLTFLPVFMKWYWNWRSFFAKYQLKPWHHTTVLLIYVYFFLNFVWLVTDVCLLCDGSGRCSFSLIWLLPDWHMMKHVEFNVVVTFYLCLCFTELYFCIGVNAVMLVWYIQCILVLLLY